jgi:hypothetical protein
LPTETYAHTGTAKAGGKADSDESVIQGRQGVVSTGGKISSGMVLEVLQLYEILMRAMPVKDHAGKGASQVLKDMEKNVPVEISYPSTGGSRVPA